MSELGTATKVVTVVVLCCRQSMAAVSNGANRETCNRTRKKFLTVGRGGVGLGGGLHPPLLLLLSLQLLLLLLPRWCCVWLLLLSRWCRLWLLLLCRLLLLLFLLRRRLGQTRSLAPLHLGCSRRGLAAFVIIAEAARLGCLLNLGSDDVGSAMVNILFWGHVPLHSRTGRLAEVHGARARREEIIKYQVGSGGPRG